MQIPTTGRIIAYAVDPATTRDLQRITIPGFEVWTTASAAAALAAVQSTGPAAAVLLAEHSESASVTVDSNANAAAPRPPDAAVLLAAARIRCPHVRRVMLVPADLMPWMIRLIHAGTADGLVALPIESHELISAVLPAERDVGLQGGQFAGAP
jgi:hypothetical protein